MPIFDEFPANFTREGTPLDPYNINSTSPSSPPSSSQSTSSLSSALSTPDSSEPSQKALALSIYMLDRIWKPPTYFLNSRQSHMHMITLPNKFVRLYSNGRVLYSSRWAILVVLFRLSITQPFSLPHRMTIKVNCPMNLENFPMDTQVMFVLCFTLIFTHSCIVQRCPLSLGSCKYLSSRFNSKLSHSCKVGYTSKDLVYKWNPSQKVKINPDMKMSQFDLIAVPVHSSTLNQHTSLFVFVVTF